MARATSAPAATSTACANGATSSGRRRAPASRHRTRRIAHSAATEDEAGRRDSTPPPAGRNMNDTRQPLTVYTFEDLTPVVDPTAWVHPSAVLIGDVIIGPRCYIGAGAVLRGDFGRIVME